jgi:hypothetical protein
MNTIVTPQLFAKKTNSLSVNQLKYRNIFYTNYSLAALHIFFFYLLSITVSAQNIGTLKKMPRSQPLVTNFYTADPSAHVFEGKIYLYCSHDIDTGIPENINGDHFSMRDYRIYSIDSINGPVTDHGVALEIKGIPWGGRQLWAPDAAFSKGTYYLYFPLKDKNDIFRIGVATSTNPAGPFIAEKNPIAYSYSIDPAVFQDDDGSFYMYFGGIWGGQLQKWENNVYDPSGLLRKKDQLAILPRVAKLSSDMKQFAETVREVKILDEAGNLLEEGNNQKRFFEAAWMHKYNGKYYFSYSTGDSHLICYAVGDNPYGPFTYKGKVLEPVEGWTNHHSIVNIRGKWYLFYHDTQLSGKTHLRNIKVTELIHLPNGNIQTVQPYQ